MGNTPQRSTLLEVQIGSHSYPDSKRSQIGIFPFILTKKPKPFAPLFDCHRCRRENYDGGLCKKVQCPCGMITSRLSTYEPTRVGISDFWQCFDYANSKRYGEVAELESLSIGIFERGIPSHILQNSTLDFEAVFAEYIHPYFTEKLRCVSNKDFFKSEQCFFKVMNCVPHQGFVTRRTQIFCYKMLTDRNLYKVQVTPVTPHEISEELFESLVLPYFQSSQHVHEDQYLNINGLECVISKSEPWNGLITLDTHIEFSAESLPPLERIKLVPYFEDLPNSLKSLDSNSLVHNIMNCYLMPHLKGWTRELHSGKTLSIAGIEFKVLESFPDKGVLSDQTVIFYDGKGISRREERRHERAAMPRNNRILLRQILTMLDSMRQLTEEFSENLISTLPVFILDVIPSNAEQNSCLICMNDFEVGHEVRALPCCK